jgi:hypothetical protein
MKAAAATAESAAATAAVAAATACQGGRDADDQRKQNRPDLTSSPHTYLPGSVLFVLLVKHPRF